MRKNCCLFLCSIAAFADAFLATPSAAASTTFLGAYYFGTENTKDPSLEDDYNPADTMDRLNHQRASLARVAAAFPPRGHSLALNHIEDVRVLDVDHRHMELHATICEEESCAAVSVPVPFPRACDNESEWQECVLGNLQELDTQAQLLLQHAEWQATNEEYHQQMADNHNLLVDFSSPSPILFPSWWIALPNDDNEMRREAETLQSLLNEAEFARELRALATRWGLPPAQEAVVGAIGPAGMILRASSKAGEVEQVDISFPVQAHTGYHLRNQVLAVLDSVQ